MPHSALKKWDSCPLLLDIPQAPDNAIKSLHIYDFDNTLYKSPHPNGELYAKTLLNQLINSSIIPNKSWWMETALLKQSFDDMLKCDAAENKEYWNGEIVKLAQSSYNDPETVSIVLTGRKEHLFSQIFTDMFLACQDVKFNGCFLRKDSVGSSTNEYKTFVIRDLIENYASSLLEVKMYDDRLNQVKQFESFFNHLRPSFTWDIIPVVATYKSLRPEDECRIIQSAFSTPNRHYNVSLGWTPKQSGYFLTRQSYKSLLKFTYVFLKKKYKMSLLPLYPLFIPCVETGDDIPETELIKILSNNNPTVNQQLHEEGDVSKIFASQPNLSGTCIISFDVHQIGFKKKKGGISILYKARPSSSKRYLWTTFEEWLITVDDRQDKKDPLQDITIMRLLHHESAAQSLRWVHLKNSFRIKTFLGHHSRMTLIHS